MCVIHTSTYNARVYLVVSDANKNKYTSQISNLSSRMKADYITFTVKCIQLHRSETTGQRASNKIIETNVTRKDVCLVNCNDSRRIFSILIHIPRELNVTRFHLAFIFLDGINKSTVRY
jgi:hypothetical protein